jgi:uncharacterized protein YbbC (DUF1343 family)
MASTMEARTTVETGLARLLREGSTAVEGRRLGLITNHSGVDVRLDHAIDLLRADRRFQLAALFGPEHGVRGSAQAGEQVGSAVDERSGLPAYSLYGETRRPTRAMLEGLDCLVYDIQNYGVRYETYAATLLESMRAAAASGLSFVVLDRPNPLNGIAVQGNILEPGQESFVGPFPLAVRHGLTVGELATMLNDQLHLGLELTVVRMRGWRRILWYDETNLPWMPLSPNIPTLTSLTLYPGTCLLEGTNVSEGRGTTIPFEVFGAPWLRAEDMLRRLRTVAPDGVAFRLTSFVPVFSKHAGQLCHGLQIHVLDRERLDAAALGVLLLSALREWHEQFAWRTPHEETGAYALDLLAGTPRLRRALEQREPPERIVAGWQEDRERFCAMRKEYLLYE